MKRFDDFLQSIQSQLRLNPLQRKSLEDELLDHLEARIEDLESDGSDRTAAERKALEEFGDAASFAGQFQPILAIQKKRWMMRFTTVAVIGSFMMLLVGYAIWPETARIAPPPQALAQQEEAEKQNVSPFGDSPFGQDGVRQADSQQDPQPSNATMKNRAVYEKLNQEVGQSFDFEEEAFLDVKLQLEENLGIPIVLHQSAELDELTPDTFVSFRASQMRLQTALDMMLDKYNATFMVREGVIVIISEEDASDPRFYERAIIDVGSVLKKIEARESSRLRAANRGGTQIVVGATGGGLGGGGGFGGGGGGMFQIPAGSQPGGLGGSGGNAQSPNSSKLAELKSTDDEDHQIVIRGPVTVVHGQAETPESMLLDVVMRSVNFDGWMEMGQGFNDIQILGGQLIVVADRSTIEGVRNLIVDLDAAMAN